MFAVVNIVNYLRTANVRSVTVRFCVPCVFITIGERKFHCECYCQYRPICQFLNCVNCIGWVLRGGLISNWPCLLSNVSTV